MSTIIQLLNNQFDQIELEKTRTYSQQDVVLLANRSDDRISFMSDLKYNQQTVINTSNPEKYHEFSAADLNEFNILPNDIESVELIDKRNGNVLKTIKPTIIDEEPLYRVGLVSDIHYNDTDTDSDPDTIGNNDGAEYSTDFTNAMELFKNENVDFVSCSGDITTDNSWHLHNFKLSYNTYGWELPFYTCVGNHDTILKARNREQWLETDHLNDKYGITRFNDSDGTSFYFVKEIDETQRDVYIYLNLEYGWSESESYNTHRARLLTVEELLTKDTVDNDDKHLYNPDTLVELDRILDLYKDDRCFIFTHIMFKDKAGTYHGNTFYNYYKDHSDVMRGDQGAYILNLIEKYDNNYWFCGHSHYKWCWQELDKDINVTKTNNSYNIHLPSLSRPLPYGIKSYTTANADSEGAIMDVYKDFVVINGYVFKEYDINMDTDITSKLVDYDGPLTLATADNFTSMSDLNTITEDEEGNIIITIRANTNEIHMSLDGINGSNYSIYWPVLRFEYLEITNENGDDITDSVTAECKIGFTDHTTNSGQYLYYFDSNHIYTMESYGLRFKMSSGSKYKNQTINIKFKLYYGLYKDSKYQNKINPIAIYKL